jgi:hypothetical protein
MLAPRVRTALLVVLVLASLGIAGYALIAYTLYPIGSLVHPQMQRTYETQRLGILAHIFTSCLAIALGPWQFIPAVCTRWPKAHRWIGRAYLGLGVLPGGIAGLYMAFHAFGGMISHTGFCLLSLAWLFTAYRGYSAARAQRFAEHRAWMIRNFALTLGAVTLRMQLGACFAAGLRFEDFYPWLAWTAWIPNVFAAEWLIRRTR